MNEPRYQLLARGVRDLDTGEDVAPGHPAWPEYDRWVAAGGIPTPMVEIKVQRSLTEAQADLVARVEELASEARARVVKYASPAEMSSWTVKLQEARAFRDTGVYTGELLQVEADARGVPLAAVVERVLANASAYAVAEGTIAGVAGRHKDAIRAFTSVEEVLRYDVEQGWPGRSPPPRLPDDLTGPP
ncbi:MAG TPA: hypothetical protein DEH78_14800 [Solibacterales bacterium]|nr:hypothetical protein [Bryobacterales bacterium]